MASRLRPGRLRRNALIALAVMVGALGVAATVEYLRGNQTPMTIASFWATAGPLVFALLTALDLFHPSDPRAALSRAITSKTPRTIEDRGGSNYFDLELRTIGNVTAVRYPLSTMGSYIATHPGSRSVITGPAGSGKSTAILRITQLLLRDHPDVVPLRVSAYTYNGGELIDWIRLAVRIQYDVSLPRHAIREIYESGDLVLLVDGLDELDAASTVEGDRFRRVRPLLDSIDRATACSGPLSVVIGCRRHFYQLIRNGGLAPTDSVEFQLQPLSLTQARETLLARVDSSKARRLASALAEVPPPAVLSTFRSPLFLDIATARSGAVLRGLGAAFPSSILAMSAEELAAHLVKEYVAERLHTVSNEARARQTLQTIARWLRENEQAQPIAGRRLPTEEFVVHQLWPIAGRWRPRLATAALGLLLLMPAVAAVEVTLRQGDWAPQTSAFAWAGVGVVATVSATESLAAWIHPRRISIERLMHWRAWSLFLGACVIGVGFAAAGSIAGSGYATGAALGFVLTFGSGAALAVRDSAPRWMLLGFGAIAGAAIQAALFVAAGDYGYLGGVVAGLIAGTLTLFASVTATLRVSAAPPGYRVHGRPAPYLRNDLIVSGASALAVSAILAPVLVSLPNSHLTIMGAILVSAGIGFGGGLGLTTGTWRRFVATVICSGSGISWDLPRTIEDAHNRGLLRVSGIGYQFGHQLIRDAVASLKEPAPRGT